MSDFEISVVIPVYNSEEYLGETLESVVAQTVGMDAVQVVIVDDGSTDGSAAICRSFQERYPANVVFHQQPNGGVSSARNAGLDRNIASVKREHERPVDRALHIRCFHGLELKHRAAA